MGATQLKSVKPCSDGGHESLPSQVHMQTEVKSICQFNPHTDLWGPREPQNTLIVSPTVGYGALREVPLN